MKEKNRSFNNFIQKKRILPVLFSLVFAVCMAFGRSLDRDGSVAYKSPVMWFGILLLAAGCTFLIRFLWDRLLKAEDRKNVKKEQSVSVRTFAMTAAVIFLCYLPVFLAVYPGFFVYDAQDELMQVITRNFSTHHPLIHVLLLGGVIQLVYKISGSYNLGIACYILFQMAALSLIYSYAVCHMRKEGMGKKAGVVMTLYLGLFPTIVMFSLCSAKDGLFTGMLLFIVLMVRELIKQPREFFKKKSYTALLGGASLLMMLFRHNGFYAFFVFMVLLFLMHKAAGLSVYLKKILLLFAGILAAYLVINKGLAAVLHADDSEHQEMLTVPIQQMARVYAMEGDTLTEEEKSTLYELLPEEALKRYTPKVSDGVKVAFNNEAYEKDPGKYRKLWIRIGMEHPFAYLNAWFMTSYGFWYPDTVIDVYKGNTVFTFTYEDSSYFGYEVEQPGERRSLFPPLNELYRWLSLEPDIQRIPVVSWLFSPGFLFWIFVFILGYFWYGGYLKKLIPYLLPGLVWMTVVLGPTYLVRYVVFLWVLMPLLMWDLTRGGKDGTFDN